MTENAQALAEKHGGAKVYADYRALLTEQRPDVVSICTWPHLHREMVEAAVAAGVTAIHCEKPMAPTWGEARAERDPKLNPGAAIHRCWREFNTRFGIGTYTDLPAGSIDVATQFIKEQYRALTHTELPAVEQTGLEGLDG